MIFTASPSTAPLPFEPPQGVTFDEFLYSDKYGHLRVRRSSEALVCGVSGRAYSTDDIEEKTSLMARALALELGWQQEREQENSRQEERVVALYSANAMDFLVVTLALHRLGATALLIHPTSTATEFKQHLHKVRADAVFTCAPLLAECLTACDGHVPKARTYILDLPGTPDSAALQSFTSSGQLLELGRQAPELPPRGPVSPKTAFYFASSGTSGLQKLVKVSHYNVISNVLQSCAFENRKATGEKLDRMLGLLPLSHAFALVVAYTMLYRGDTIVLLPKFDMQQMLKSVQVHRINRLYLVPPIVAALAKNPFLLKMFDLSTVGSVVLGAAPLEARVADQIRALCPHWALLQGYGVTEAAVVISCTRPSDILAGSSGTLLPRIEARLVAADGQEVTAFDTVGELCIRSPSVVEGYVGDDAANQATFTPDGWLRTGDVAVFRQSPASGEAHLCIVDRMKDMIKVYGLQVSPAEIEAELLSHPAVAQAAVIRVADDASGEVPRAIIVLQPDALRGLEADEDEEEALKDKIAQVIEEKMSTSHWLKGGIVFVESIPTSQAGKVLKKVLREQYGTR